MDFTDSYGAIESNHDMEIRKRGKGGSTYSRLPDEDEYDDELLVPTLGRKHPTAIQSIPKKTFGKYHHILNLLNATFLISLFLWLFLGPKFCFFFSFFGVVFLSIIGFLLSKNSLYIKVRKENGNIKPKLSEGVMGAVFMWSCVMFVSGYLWFRAEFINERRENDVRLLD